MRLADPCGLSFQETGRNSHPHLCATASALNFPAPRCRAPWCPSLPGAGGWDRNRRIRPRGAQLPPDLVQGLFALPQGNQGGSLLLSGLPQLQRPLVPLGGLPSGPGGGYPPQLGGRYQQSAPFLWGRPRFPSSWRLQIPGRVSRLPLGIAAPVIHPPGFPVAALPLGTHCRSLPLPSLRSPIPGAPSYSSREYSRPRNGNLSLLLWWPLPRPVPLSYPQVLGPLPPLAPASLSPQAALPPPGGGSFQRRWISV